MPPLPPTADALHLIPDPSTIHERISALTRERTLLRRLLRISLAARRERDSTSPTSDRLPVSREEARSA